MTSDLVCGSDMMLFSFLSISLSLTLSDLGRHDPVVGEALLYEGLSSRRFLVSDVDSPAVHPVLLTYALQAEDRMCNIAFYIFKGVFCIIIKIGSQRETNSGWHEHTNDIDSTCTRAQVPRHDSKTHFPSQRMGAFVTTRTEIWM